MATIKPGDMVWVKAGPVPSSELWLDRVRVFGDPSTAIPDHPALPMIASWLADTDYQGWALFFNMVKTARDKADHSIGWERWNALYQVLTAALTEGTGDGND